MLDGLVSISSRVVLRADHQPPPLLSPAIDGLQDIDKLLLIFEDPVQFVVVPGSKIAHHVLVAPEEHQGHWVVELWWKGVSGLAWAAE